MNDGDAPILELQVPKSKWAVFGAVIVTAFVLFFTVVALHNLWGWIAILPSTLWLLLVGVIVIDLIRSKGINQIVVEILSAFSFREFIWAIRQTNGQNEIQFGNQLCGCRLVRFRIAVENIEHVKWSTGQASHIAGRDMNDWSVAVWYDHGDRAKSERNKGWRFADQEIHIVGPAGRKAEVATFGHSLLDFLRQSGANLIQGENDCTFVRQSNTINS